MEKELNIDYVNQTKDKKLKYNDKAIKYHIIFRGGYPVGYCGIYFARVSEG